jgi:hypothetical protein
MTRLSLRAALAASLAAAALLAGCGGDDDTPTSSTSGGQVPTSAVASDASLEAFALAQAPSETAEPLSLDLVSTFPASDNTEPIAVP